MKSILKIATIAAAAITLTAGTAFARDMEAMKLHYGRGQHVMLWGMERPTTTIGFFGHGSGFGEKKMMWQGREMTHPVVMHDAHGRAFVVFRTSR